MHLVIVFDVNQSAYQVHFKKHHGNVMPSEKNVFIIDTAFERSCLYFFQLLLLKSACDKMCTKKGLVLCQR